MKNKVIPWSELSPHRLIGRDLEIKFETVVERAQIESILLGSEIMFCLKPDGGGSAPARNFTKIEQEPWKAKRILPYEVRCREEAPPELREDGTILIRSLGSYALVIHPEGDNIKIPEAN